MSGGTVFQNASPYLYIKWQISLTVFFFLYWQRCFYGVYLHQNHRVSRHIENMSRKIAVILLKSQCVWYDLHCRSTCPRMTVREIGMVLNLTFVRFTRETFCGQVFEVKIVPGVKKGPASEIRSLEIYVFYVKHLFPLGYPPTDFGRNYLNLGEREMINILYIDYANVRTIIHIPRTFLRSERTCS